MFIKSTREWWKLECGSRIREGKNLWEFFKNSSDYKHLESLFRKKFVSTNPSTFIKSIKKHTRLKKSFRAAFFCYGWWKKNYLLLSTEKEQRGSSNGKIFKRPWHDRIKCLLQRHEVQTQTLPSLSSLFFTSSSSWLSRCDEFLRRSALEWWDYLWNHHAW